MILETILQHYHYSHGISKVWSAIFVLKNYLILEILNLKSTQMQTTYFVLKYNTHVKVIPQCNAENNLKIT